MNRLLIKRYCVIINIVLTESINHQFSRKKGKEKNT